jgi:peptide/nickel transport system ATP-binding protein
MRATILASLRAMTVERGISIIYITHDLATAYQIGENIVVLYRGSVAEVGDVERVVKTPQHPYTRQLISSIPAPSAERTWVDESAAPSAAIQAGGTVGCKFADRCPAAMPICVQSRPPFFQVDRHRAVACYLYQSAPVLPPDEMLKVFAEPVFLPKTGGPVGR